MTHPPVLDLAVIRSLSRTGGTEFAVEMAQLYLDRTAELVATLERAAADGDIKAMSAAAHTLASSSGTIGAHAVELPARAAERAALAGDATAAANWVPAIVESVATGGTSLRALIAAGGTPLLPLVAVAATEEEAATLTYRFADVADSVVFESGAEALDSVEYNPPAAIVVGRTAADLNAAANVVAWLGVLARRAPALPVLLLERTAEAPSPSVTSCKNVEDVERVLRAQLAGTADA